MYCVKQCAYSLIESVVSCFCYNEVCTVQAGSTITWNGFGLESGLDWNKLSGNFIFINFIPVWHRRAYTPDRCRLLSVMQGLML